MNQNSVYILDDRGILYISGQDSKDFLQNIISNDLVNTNTSSIKELAAKNAAANLIILEPKGSEKSTFSANIEFRIE